MTSKMKHVRVMPLGGLDQFGMNCCLLECGDDLVMVDCGLTFPEPPGYGIDFIIPEFSWVLENIDRLRAIVLTHGHEDHIGALPFLLEQVDVPLYGSALTLAMVRRKLEEGDIEDVAYNIVESRSVVQIGGLSFEFIHVNHSIPQALAVAAHTPQGTMLFTGDWKIDLNPVGEAVADLYAFASLGERGVLAILGDSTNAITPGSSRSESVVQTEIEAILREKKGRVIIAMFSSNVLRVAGIIEAAARVGRRVALLGRSLERNYQLAIDNDVVPKAPAHTLVDVTAIDRNKDEELVVLTTGSQAEPRSSLARMAYDDHNLLKLKSTDTVLLSARVIPGNEIGINTMIDAICRRGIEVITPQTRPIHGSGHAHQEEMKLLLNLVRPRYIVPIHGDFRMRSAHASLAQKTVRAMPLMINDGDILEFTGDSHPQVVGRIPSGRVAVDGKLLGDADDIQIRDRKKLAATGVIIAFVVVNHIDGSIANGPSLMQHGFLSDVEESDLLMLAAEDFAKAALLELNEQVRTDTSEVSEALRVAVRRFFRKETNLKPVVIPIVHEL